jgi:NADH-quinone oxidoreductase subunit N
MFGFALLYASSGSLHFSTLAPAGEVVPGLPVAAALLILSGMAFKLSAAPFHLWTPDVYAGSPAPITAFLASVGKAAPFVVMLRLVYAGDFLLLPGVTEAIAVLAVLSMLAGNLLALLQNNLKRMLAYSSVAHIGYALVVLCVAFDPANKALAVEAGSFYMLAYVPTSVAAFALVALINAGGEGDDRSDIDELSGLFWRDPLLATLMVVAMLSLAGIPLTAGFIGKFYIFAAAVSGAHWVLLAVLVLGSALGIYYYLRVVFRMTQQAPAELAALNPGALSRLVMVAVVATVLALGVLPQPLMGYLAKTF